MKRLFEESGYRLSETEQVEIWQRIAKAQQRSTPTRWLFRPAVVTVTVAVAGLFIFLLFSDRNVMIIEPGEMKSFSESPARDVREVEPEPAVAAPETDGATTPIPETEAAPTSPRLAKSGGNQAVDDATTREVESSIAGIRQSESPREFVLALADEEYDEVDSADVGEFRNEPAVDSAVELTDAAAAPPQSARGSTVALPAGRDRSAAALETITTPKKERVEEIALAVRVPDGTASASFATSLGNSSYALMRHYLDNGALPPPESVRMEEYLGNFKPGVAAADGEDFFIHTDGAPSPFGPGYYLLRITVIGRGSAAMSAGGQHGSSHTLGEDVELRVDFDPRQIVQSRLLGYEAHDQPVRGLARNTINASRIETGQRVTTLYEVQLSAGAQRQLSQLETHPQSDIPLATVFLRYQVPTSSSADSGQPQVLEQVVATGQVSPSFDAAQDRLQLMALVAEFAEILGGSQWARDNSFATLVPLANKLAIRMSADEAVVEFAQLVQRAAIIEAASATTEE